MSFTREATYHVRSLMRLFGSARQSERCFFTLTLCPPASLPTIVNPKLKAMAGPTRMHHSTVQRRQISIQRTVKLGLPIDE